MPGIFISYRRSDNPDATGRIYDRLVAEFGKARVFKDVDSIPLGQDFRGHLNEVVGSCAVVLAVIGPRWVDARSAAGNRRLEDPDDFVRIELEAALARDIPVVPVLVAHAAMPGATDLPASLASMVFRQSIEVRPDPDFHNDATRLVSALRLMLDPNAPQLALPVQSKRSWVPWLVGMLAFVAALAVALAIPAFKHLRETPSPETRIAIALPMQAGVSTFALSPDGRQVVYQHSGDNEFRLWLRALSATTAQPLPGTEGGVSPFWSPDGRSIGFFSAGSLKRLELGGGQVQSLATLLPGNSPIFGVWSLNGDILFTSGAGKTISRVASSGGPVTEVTRPAVNETKQVPLRMLPDGKHFLIGMVGGTAQGTYLGTLDGSPPVRLTTDSGPATWLPTGWMVWVRFSASESAPTGPLLAQRLDLGSARLVGEPVSIAGDVGDFSATESGLIAYRTVRVTEQRQLSWVDRSGTELGTVGAADSTLNAPRVAPDGRRVAVSRLAHGNRDLWLLDGARASRMTFNEADDNYPVWSPDGLRITFSSNRSGVFNLYERLASGAGGEKSLKKDETADIPSGWSADDRYLLYFNCPIACGHIDVLPRSGDGKSFVFLNTSFNEIWGQFSPDGKWVAYQSNESGKYEIFVRPFHPPGSAGEADSNAAQWMVSTAGGIAPTWSADGKELYYLNPAGVMMAASIKVDRFAVVPGTPIKLFDAHIVGGGVDNGTGRQYDVARDGRFLINRVRNEEAIPAITLLQNWNPGAKKQ